MLLDTNITYFEAVTATATVTAMARSDAECAREGMDGKGRDKNAMMI